MIMLMLTLTTVLTLMTIPALAMENVEGADSGNFGKPTSVEEVQVVGGSVSESDNVNRSKDSAFVPPPFGSPSSNTPGTGELLTPNISGIAPSASGYTVSSGDSSYINTGTGVISYPDSTDSYIPSSSATKFTLPDGMYYSDGSIGTLKIPSLSLTVKVYEEESLENLKKGAGHFKSTSCWDGNVGIAGHNRGVADHFGNIHNLSIGSKITYTTVYGTRTYEVYYVGKISETDFTRLERSSENIITLITCVRDVPDQRWCVQARQVS